VVIAVLALGAALVAPLISAQRQGIEHRAFRTGLTQVAAEARIQAVERRQELRLRYDDGLRTLTLERVEEGEEPLRTIQIPQGILATSFQEAGQVVSSGDWAVRFLPDGTSDSGGIEFDDDGVVLAWYVDERARAALSEGTLPNPNDQRWPAGSLEQRV
jgi:hypothetical protein